LPLGWWVGFCHPPNTPGELVDRLSSSPRTDALARAPLAIAKRFEHHRGLVLPPPNSS
jgi:hypothetical protein